MNIKKICREVALGLVCATAAGCGDHHNGVTAPQATSQGPLVLFSNPSVLVGNGVAERSVESFNFYPGLTISFGCNFNPATPQCEAFAGLDGVGSVTGLGPGFLIFQSGWHNYKMVIVGSVVSYYIDDILRQIDAITVPSPQRLLFVDNAGSMNVDNVLVTVP